jgi:hypothetical protein
VAITLAVFGAGRAANVEAFLQLAATDDGGAWLLVDLTESLRIGEPGSRHIELRRITRDGRISSESVGRDEPIEAIATAGGDGALWAVTERAVLRRDRAGTWTALDVPPSTALTRKSLQAFYAIAPLAQRLTLSD